MQSQLLLQKKKAALQRHKQRIEEYKRARQHLDTPSLPSYTQEQATTASSAATVEVSCSDDANGTEQEVKMREEKKAERRVGFLGGLGMKARNKGRKGEQKEERKLRRTGVRPTMWSSLRSDSDYGKALAERIDLVSLIVLAMAYVVAVILILVLQSGYIPLVPR